MYVKQKRKPKVREAKRNLWAGGKAAKDCRLNQPLPLETYDFKSGLSCAFNPGVLFPAGTQTYQENQTTRNKNGKGD